METKSPWPGYQDTTAFKIFKDPDKKTRRGDENPFMCPEPENRHVKFSSAA